MEKPGENNIVCVCMLYKVYNIIYSKLYVCVFYPKAAALTDNNNSKKKKTREETPLIQHTHTQTQQHLDIYFATHTHKTLYLFQWRRSLVFHRLPPNLTK